MISSNASFPALWVVLSMAGLACGQTLTPPPVPDVPPLIGESYSSDQDGDRIDDDLQRWRDETLTSAEPVVPERDALKAEAVQETLVDVELIFTQPIVQGQIDVFLQMGGEITYMHKALSYGWNGRIPSDRISMLPAAIGPSLVLVARPRVTEPHLDLATQTGRVRPIWRSGFAGSPQGFDGDPDMTIGIIDSGVDAGHVDVAPSYIVDLDDVEPGASVLPVFEGRCMYWKDFSPDKRDLPADTTNHGSYIAGVVWGTGRGQELMAEQTDALYWTDFADPDAWGVSKHPVSLPGGQEEITLTSIVYFTEARSNFEFACHYHVPDGSLFSWLAHNVSSGAAFTPFPMPNDGACSTSLYGAKDGVIRNRLEPYPKSSDGFSRLRGVAPGCRLAVAKDRTDTEQGSPSDWTSAALMDLVDKRKALNLRVVNISSGVRGEPGIADWYRQRINSAVGNGVLVVISAGNDGGGDVQDGRTHEIDDPGRAALALTVGASNDKNLLTDYTSWGFSNPLTVYKPSREDYKPDLIAPGGSDRCSYIMSIDSGSSDGAWMDLQPQDYANGKGTSLAAPFVAGCAALVIEAMEQADPGFTWDFYSDDHPRFVKMVLCATATETNGSREDSRAESHPTLERNGPGPNGYPVGKDPYEGYGLLNADAAVEAVYVTYDWGSQGRDSLGAGATDRRAWARRVILAAQTKYDLRLLNPPEADFDLYLFSGTPGPTGTPRILASSAQPGLGVHESISYTSPSRDDHAILVVKRIAGKGEFRLTRTP